MRCGWDLADLYRDELTLRQLWVRLKALPADAPLVAALNAAEEQAQRAEEAAAVDDAMAMMRGR